MEELKSVDLLRSLVKQKAMRLNLSQRQIAIQVGISNTALGEFWNGRLPRIETFLILVKWLGVDAMELLRSDLDSEPLAVKVETILNSYPELRQVFEEVVMRIEQGTAPPELLGDVVRYTRFRLNQ